MRLDKMTYGPYLTVARERVLGRVNGAGDGT